MADSTPILCVFNFRLTLSRSYETRVARALRHVTADWGVCQGTVRVDCFRQAWVASPELPREGRASARSFFAQASLQLRRQSVPKRGGRTQAGGVRVSRAAENAGLAARRGSACLKSFRVLRKCSALRCMRRQSRSRGRSPDTRARLAGGAADAKHRRHQGCVHLVFNETESVFLEGVVFFLRRCFVEPRFSRHAPRPPSVGSSACHERWLCKPCGWLGVNTDFSWLFTPARQGSDWNLRRF